MKFYYHRDEKGVLKAKYDENMMKELSWNFNGEWRPYKTKDENTRCFVMNEDRVMNIQGDYLSVYFWKGDILVEKGY